MRAIWIALICLALPLAASAHAFLDHSDPKVGSEVSISPTQLKIWFTMGIKPDGSAIKVYDARQKQLDLKDSHVDEKDNTLLTVSLPKLPAGEYTVLWEAICIDGHQTTGDFKFTIKG